MNPLGTKWEVRSVQPDSLIRAGFPSEAAAKTWLASHYGRLALAYYVIK